AHKRNSNSFGCAFAHTESALGITAIRRVINRAAVDLRLITHANPDVHWRAIGGRRRNTLGGWSTANDTHTVRRTVPHPGRGGVGDGSVVTRAADDEIRSINQIAI